MVTALIDRAQPTRLALSIPVLKHIVKVSLKQARIDLVLGVRVGFSWSTGGSFPDKCGSES